MTWQKWVVIGFLIFSYLVTITQIGKPRKPLEAGTVAIMGVFQGLFVWLIITA